MTSQGPLKSPALVEFYLGILVQLMSDIQSAHLPSMTAVSDKDIAVLKQRVQSEGLAFMTKTLPKLGKAFDRALESLVLEVPREFKRAHADRTIPAFLQGMFSAMFVEGRLQDEFDESLVRDLRQICYLVYKLELPFSPRDESNVITRFIETEQELAVQVLPATPLMWHARELAHSVLQGIDLEDLSLKHGPGAVATGEKLEEKWEFTRLYKQIHQMYPYHEYFTIGSRRWIIDRALSGKRFIRKDSGEARVVLVPKDSRGPRLISCEPLEYQWIQQGVNSALVRHLSKHALTKGQINFLDQTVNAELALVSSRHGYFCTIDLKDASDRVSMELVDYLFPEYVSKRLRAIRSTVTLLPDGRKIKLRKHAPMGSAVCFSVEALVFWVLCVTAVCRCTGDRVGDAAREVFVYGDDIIVPTKAYTHVLDALTGAGLRVNTDKCYAVGKFRESCGVDAFNGVVVTPTKLSTVWSGKPSDSSAFAAYTAYANDFARKQYTGVAEYLWRRLESVYGKIPYGTDRAGYPCRLCSTYLDSIMLNRMNGFKVRWNRSLQRFETMVKTLVPRVRPTTLDSWPRALRNLTGNAGDTPHLVTVPRRVKVSRKWMVP